MNEIHTNVVYRQSSLKPFLFDKTESSPDLSSNIFKRKKKGTRVPKNPTFHLPPKSPFIYLENNSQTAKRDAITSLQARSNDSMVSKPRERKGIQDKKSFDIEGFKEVQSWLKTVGETSRGYYILALKKFCEFSGGKNPKQLILLRDEEIRNPDPNSRTGIRDLIYDFRKHLEKEGYAPKTIGSRDGAIRGFFSSNLGKQGMINIGNYANGQITLNKDLVPTLEEVKKMIEVSDISVKFSIIFLAQTGMRPEDALKLKIGDVQRELELGRSPLAILFYPEKDRNKNIGERITFLGKDGIKILKMYIDWRKRKGEVITPDSPLFIGRSKKYDGKAVETLTQRMLNIRIKEASKKAGIGNGDNKYGRMRAYCLRKFFITQLTNHGVEDKIVNFFTSHTIPSVDLAYWSRRIDVLREIYRQREKYLNPISESESQPSIEEIEQRIDGRIEKYFEGEEFEKIICNIAQKVLKENEDNYESIIVTSEDEIIEYTNKGYDCQIVGENRWLMKQKSNNRKFNYR